MIPAGPPGIRVAGRRRPDRRPSKPRIGRVTVLPEKRALRIGRTIVPQADILKGLAALRCGADPDKEDSNADATLVVNVSEEEHHRLKQIALEGNTSLRSLVRRALIAGGLIGPPEL